MVFASPTSFILAGALIWTSYSNLDYTSGYLVSQVPINNPIRYVTVQAIQEVLSTNRTPMTAVLRCHCDVACTTSQCNPGRSALALGTKHYHTKDEAE